MGCRAMTWMVQHADEHRDPQTGEINMTTLAEATAREFDMYDGDEPDERLFIWAFRIAERDKARHSGRITPALGGIVNACESDWF